LRPVTNVLPKPSRVNLLILAFCCYVFIGFAQNQKPKDINESKEYLDSLLVDRNPANYSIRIFSNFKSQSFRFTDDDSNLSYQPNNRSGVGLGFASKKLLVDIAINIRSKKKEPTKRFDIRASYKLDSHFFHYFFQYYKGFNLRSDQEGLDDTFRKNVVSVANGINYLYLFNKNSYQVGALRSVITDQSKTGVSFGLGGFGLLLNQQGNGLMIDPSMVSGTMSSSDNKIFGIGIGGLAGLAGFFSLGGNYYSAASFDAGVGMMYRDVRLDPQNPSLGSPLLYKINASVVVGYIRETYYLNLSFQLGYYSNEIITAVDELVSMSQAKIAFGYKIFKKNVNTD